MAERKLDSDRLRALAATPAAVRPAFATLWNLDLALADVVATTSEPGLGAIRLAWWRERLEELDTGAPLPGEPRLSAIAHQLIERGISGKELSRLEDAWLPLLQPFPWDEAQAEGLCLRGRVLFGIGARLLGWDAVDGEAAGALWSLVDGARNCSDFYARMFLLEQARKSIQGLPRQRPPKSLRPLTVLAALAVHDVVRGKPLAIGKDFGRISVAAIHRLRGALPRG